MQFDSLDRHLMHLLDLNARMSLTTLANKLKCSRETVNYRIKRLQKSGAIKGFKTKINWVVAQLRPSSDVMFYST